ncbi:hypothetical protein KM043_012526 [Ampulex compressa]|nr:hypothetical protein KM043_012526 [Ampulex compressa]
MREEGERRSYRRTAPLAAMFLSSTRAPWIHGGAIAPTRVSFHIATEPSRLTGKRSRPRSRTAGGVEPGGLVRSHGGTTMEEDRAGTTQRAPRPFEDSSSRASSRTRLEKGTGRPEPILAVVVARPPTLGPRSTALGQNGSMPRESGDRFSPEGGKPLPVQGPHCDSAIS